MPTLSVSTHDCILTYCILLPKKIMGNMVVSYAIHFSSLNVHTCLQLFDVIAAVLIGLAARETGRFMVSKVL